MALTLLTTNEVEVSFLLVDLVAAGATSTKPKVQEIVSQNIHGLFLDFFCELLNLLANVFIQTFWSLFEMFLSFSLLHTRPTEVLVALRALHLVSWLIFTHSVNFLYSEAALHVGTLLAAVLEVEVV